MSRTAWVITGTIVAIIIVGFAIAAILGSTGEKTGPSEPKIVRR